MKPNYAMQRSALVVTPLAVVMLVVAAVVACAEPARSGSLTVEVAEANPDEVNRAMEILIRRFSGVLPSWRSSVTATVQDRTITFTFRGTAPAEDELHYLTFTRGELLVGPADEPQTSWVSDRDVREVSLNHAGEVPYLDVQLRPDAGRRLADKTANNVGRTLLVTWDGREMLTAPILGTFGQEFVFNAPSLSEGRLMKVILDAGRLPIAIENADYKHGV